jgi:endonuclease YncB( thermonuclease family)
LVKEHKLSSLFAFILSLAVSLPALAGDYDRPAPHRDDRYTYQATIKRVIDGDTVVADIDLGFHTWRRDVYLRLARINAPEPRGSTREAGLAAGDWLRDRVEGKEIIIRTVKDKRGQDQLGSFRRYLAELFLDGKNLNDNMVRLGLAEYRK